MSEITQELGFDVSQAINALDKLNAAINSHNATLSKLQDSYKNFKAGPALNSATQAVNGLGSATENASSRISQAATKTNTTLQTLGNAGSKNVGTLSSALDGLGRRLLAANLASRGISAVTSSLSESIGDAVAFERGLAEIQTIAPALRGDIDGLGDAVRRLSDEFNQPLGNVTEGLYQTISNQVQGTAAQFDVLSSSMKFGKVTASSTDQSVQLLTASINGFSKDASEADDIAAKWFKTIELGRTRADELSNSIGRVSKLSSQVGVSMEEMQAALATITITGVKTSEAITQLRGVFNGLIKPTDKMNDALEKLGFTSGEQAIEVLGLTGTLDALVDATKGSTSALSEMFPRVRGLTGVLSLAGQGAEKFRSNLRAIEGTASSVLNDSYQLVIETDAEKATKRINALKNAITTEFGTSAIQTFNRVSDAADSFANSAGLRNTEDLFAGVASSAPAATAAILAYATGAKAASLTSSQLGTSVGGLVGKFGTAATAMLGAVAAVNAFDGAVENALRGARSSFDAQISDQAKAIQRSYQERVRAEEQVWEDINQRTKNGIGEQLREFNRRNDAIEKSASRLREQLAGSVGDVFGQRESLVDAARQKASEARSESVAAQQSSTQLLIRAEDELFDRGLKRVSNQTQFNALLNRSVDLGKKATEALSGATNRDERLAADDLFSRAAALEKQANAIAQQVNSQAGLVASESVLKLLTEQRTQALQRFAQTQDDIAQKASQAARDQADALKKLQEQFGNIGQGPNLFGDDGNPLSGDARAESLKQFESRLNDFRTSALDLNLDLGEFLDLQSFTSEISKSLGEVEVKRVKFGDINAQLSEQVDSFFANKSVGLTVDLVFQANGKTVTDPSKLLDEIAGAKQSRVRRIQLEGEIEQLEVTSRADRAGATTGLDVANDTAANPIRGLINGFRQVASDGVQGADEVAEAYNAAFKSVRATVLDGNVTATELAGTIKSINAAISAFGDNTSMTIVDPVQIDALRRAKADLEAVFNTQLQIQQKASQIKLLDGVDTSSVDELQVKAETIGFIFNRVTEPLEAGVVSATNELTSAVSEASRLKSGLDSAAASAAAINVNLGSGTTSRTQVTGKRFSSLTNGNPFLNTSFQGNPFVFRNNGGAVRGADSVPTMLTPGEFVVNSKSSHRFKNQLESINAGVAPASRSSSSVDNSIHQSIGDVYLSGQSNMSPRDLARELRREVRRGTSRLN